MVSAGRLKFDSVGSCHSRCPIAFSLHFINFRVHHIKRTALHASLYTLEFLFSTFFRIYREHILSVYVHYLKEGGREICCCRCPVWPQACQPNKTVVGLDGFFLVAGSNPMNIPEQYIWHIAYGFFLA